MKRHRPDQRRAVQGSAAAIAAEALVRAASRLTYRAGKPALDQALLSRFEQTLFTGGRSDRLALADEMRIAGISSDDIIDLYIPELACRLGTQWCEDQRGFAEVAIGTANLQSMLHDIAVEWPRSHVARQIDLSAVLIVREDQHHTLGAMVFAAQLRRVGVSVRLLLGISDEDIAADMKYGDETLVGISASQGENLENIRKLVVKLRNGHHIPRLIALGGSILSSPEDVSELTGVDYVGNDPDEIIRLCRKSIAERQEMTRQRRSTQSLVRGT